MDGEARQVKIRFTGTAADCRTVLTEVAAAIVLDVVLGPYGGARGGKVHFYATVTTPTRKPHFEEEDN